MTAIASDIENMSLNVTEEIPNHVERDSALQHVHPFRMSKGMWTHRPIQA